MNPPENTDELAIKRARAEIETLCTAIRDHEAQARRDAEAIARELMVARAAWPQWSSSLASLVTAIATVAALVYAAGQLGHLQTGLRTAGFTETSRHVLVALQDFTDDARSSGGFRNGDPPDDVERKLATLIYEIVWAEKFHDLGRDDQLARALESVVDSVCTTLRQDAYAGIAGFLERRTFFGALPPAAKSVPGAETAGAAPAETLTERLATCLKKPA